tara:strand:- start:589 stop:849 length:261 start_codon:yes stop_codon:yes gene_type:complete
MTPGHVRLFQQAGKGGHCKLGKEWEEAHEICQAHEGEQPFDWLHAVVHRIEGDDWNAGYWYQRAGKERHDGSVEDELQMIRAEIDK